MNKQARQADQALQRKDLRKQRRKEDRVNFNNLMKLNRHGEVLNTYPGIKPQYSKGFGDFLRGSVYLYKLSELFKFDIKINMTEHPIGKYFESNIVNTDTYGPIHSEFLGWEFSPPDTDFSRRQLLKLLLNNNKCNVYFVEPWPGYFKHHMLEKNERDFIQSFLTPTASITQKVNNFIGDMPSFDILHIRTGDKQMIEDITKINTPDEEYDFTVELYMNSIERHLATITNKNNPIVLISDSLVLNSKLKSELNLDRTKSPASLEIFIISSINCDNISVDCSFVILTIIL